VLLGAPFVALSLLGACLDYAGEDLFQGCDAGVAPSGSGSGSGSGSATPAADAGTRSDCGAPAAPPGSGSGSGSGS
jgi:hypothetical protein